MKYAVFNLDDRDADWAGFYEVPVHDLLIRWIDHLLKDHEGYLIFHDPFADGEDWEPPEDWKQQLTYARNRTYHSDFFRRWYNDAYPMATSAVDIVTDAWVREHGWRLPTGVYNMLRQLFAKRQASDVRIFSEEARPYAQPLYLPRSAGAAQQVVNQFKVLLEAMSDEPSFWIDLRFFNNNREHGFVLTNLDDRYKEEDGHRTVVVTHHRSGGPELIAYYGLNTSFTRYGHPERWDQFVNLPRGQEAEALFYYLFGHTDTPSLDVDRELFVDVQFTTTGIIFERTLPSKPATRSTS